MKTIYLFLLLIFFITSIHAQIYDFEGNKYDTVRIGTQVWLKQNIRSLYYSDGTPINSGVFAYNNDTSIAKTHGYLYHYNAALRKDTIPPIQGICPKKFHFPTNQEWLLLIKHIGGSAIGPVPMTKYSGATYLKDNISWNGLNTYGLTIMPGGYKELTINANFRGLGSEVWYWAGYSGLDSGLAFYFTNDEYIQPFRYFETWKPGNALYCRCVMDDITSGIEEINGHKININIYPNPATTDLFITGISAENREIKLFNALGQEILTKKNIGSDYIKIDFSSLSKGIYILTIKSGDNIITRKVIKE